MKKIAVVCLAVAALAMPVGGFARAKAHCHTVKTTYCTVQKPCRVASCQRCAPCINPLAPVAGVVGAVGSLVGGVVGIFGCDPCRY